VTPTIQKAVFIAGATAGLLCNSNAVFATTTAYANFSGGSACSTPSGIGTCFGSLKSVHKTDGSVADTGNITSVFSGLDSSGMAATGSISGRAWAETTTTNLRSYATATFDNPIINANNTPFLTGGYDSFPVINAGGVPSAVDSHAIAYTADTVGLIAGQFPYFQLTLNVSYVQLTLTVSGMISTDEPVRSFATVFQNNGSSAFSGGSGLYYQPSPGSFTSTITTNPIAVVNGMFTFGLGLYTEVLFDLRYSPSSEHGSVTGTVDYTHTLTVDSISAFSSTGDRVDVFAAFGQSGTLYPLAAVPEPGAYLMLITGLMGVAAATRRRQNNPR